MKIKKFESELLDVKELTPTVRHFVFSVPDGFSFNAGSIMNVSIPVEDGKIKRLYSIASNPANRGFIEFCIKYVENGPASKFLFNLKRGEKVEFLGPFGTFTIKDKSKDLILISTGAGIAPFRSMLYEFFNEGFDKKILMLNGYRFENEVLYENELIKFKKEHNNFDYKIVISRPKTNIKNKGRVQILVDKYIKNDFEGDFYLCGLNDMIESVRVLLIEKGFDSKRIYFERFDV